MVYSPFRTPNLDPRIAALMPDPRMINMVAQAPPEKQGLLARIGSGLANRFMPAPGGGLLSEQDIKNARSQGLLGLGASLLAAGGRRADQGGTLANLGAAIQQGQGAYQGAVDQSMGRQMAGQEMQARQAELAQGQAQQAQQAGLQKIRQQIISEHPLPADVGGMANWVEAVLPKFMAAGDEEYVQRLSAIRSTLGNGQGQQKEEGKWVTVTGPDGKPMERYVTAKEAGQGIPVYERPQRDTDDAMTLNSQFLNEERLEKSYNDRIDGVQTTIDAYLGAKEAAKMHGAGDLQVLYSFIRALDPGSVVRGEELVLARQAASLRANAEILKQRFEKEGGALSQVQRDQMLELMRQMVELKAKRARGARRSAEARAAKFGLDVYLYDPLQAYDAAQGDQAGQPNEFGVVSGGSSTAPSRNYDQYRQGKPQ